MNIEYRHLWFNSLDYQKSLTLRNQILRIPLGLSLFDERLDQEIKDIHIGGFDGDDLVACLVLTGNPPEMKMRQVAVSKAYQNKGIGTAMAKYAEDYLRDEGYESVYCHARDVAVPFYVKMGYTQEGETFTEVGIEHYLLRKVL